MIDIKPKTLLILSLLICLLLACNSSSSNAKTDASQGNESENLPTPNIEISSLNLSANPTRTPASPSITPPTAQSTATDVNTPTLTLTAAPTLTITTDTALLRGEHFWLARPFSTNNSTRDLVESAYPYGTTALGLQPHHGVDIPNLYGTAIRAVASGIVFYAGDDLNTLTFGPQANFYGNVIVIEHQFPLADNPDIYFKFYTLYGHVSEFFVRTGDRIAQFQEIGAVGQEGVAIGPHLHLEVRIGDPTDYTATYNPNLWIQPYKGYGVLAGRVSQGGQLLTDVEVEAISQATGRTYYTFTYHYESVNSDPWFMENFVMPDLIEGTYDVRVKYGGRIAYQTVVEVKPEQIALISASLQ